MKSKWDQNWKVENIMKKMIKEIRSTVDVEKVIIG
jgi:hypothetical protein